jgi:hypothetical protein
MAENFHAVTGLFALFLLPSVRLCVTSEVGPRRVLSTNATLTKSPCRRRNWLLRSVQETSGDVQSQTFPKSLARQLKPWKSDQQKTDTESASFSQTEPTSNSMLTRSFASSPIIPISKPEITNPSNAGHLCSANNPLRITNTEPAERRVLSSALAYGGDGGDDLGGTGIPPWIANPYQLVSWWEMERFSAASFYQIGRYLAVIKEGFLKSGATHIEAGALKRPKKLDVEEISGGMALEMIRYNCNQIGLTISLKCVEKLFDLGERGCTIQEFTATLSQLSETITWEIADKTFLFIPATRSKRYEEQQAFGDAVANAFPSAAYDIREAGTSFACARYTASVFHLMRVLEIGLTAFGKLFPAVPVNRENWQQIIEKIESEIRALPQAAVKPPDWKSKQEQYSQIANSFMFFKDAWRNYTAHARGKYTEDEADSIYRNVRSFMQSLAKTGLSE